MSEKYTTTIESDAPVASVHFHRHTSRAAEEAMRSIVETGRLRELVGSELRILIVLLSRLDHVALREHGRLVCRFSRDEVRGRAGLGEAMYTRALKWLTIKGIVSIEKGSRGAIAGFEVDATAIALPASDAASGARATMLLARSCGARASSIDNATSVPPSLYNNEYDYKDDNMQRNVVVDLLRRETFGQSAIDELVSAGVTAERIRQAVDAVNRAKGVRNRRAYLWSLMLRGVDRPQTNHAHSAQRIVSSQRHAAVEERRQIEAEREQQRQTIERLRREGRLEALARVAIENAPQVMRAVLDRVDPTQPSGNWLLAEICRRAAAGEERQAPGPSEAVPPQADQGPRGSE